MGNIVLLDELTINKIAAGEVIERPASVIKEMVENSIDAGATSISVEIKNGGISYIRITDNGKGIMPDDMEIAFERHATSKIRKADDLATVKSMGFRGEALASIAAISNVEMVSKTAGSDIGNKIVVEAGKVIEQGEIGSPVGTTITVRNLFFNTPVRYKFLKKDYTESGYIEDAVNRLALINPNIAFKLINNGKVILQTSGNGDMQAVIYNIYGKDIAAGVLNVDYNYEDIHIKGVVGKPEIARSNRSNQIFFVNHRYVKDKTLSSAAEKGFKGLLTIGKYGFLVLNIDVAPEKLDVNVHPAKLEVRFEEENKVFKAVYHAITDTLLKGDLIKDTEKQSEKQEEVSKPVNDITSKEEEVKNNFASLFKKISNNPNGNYTTNNEQTNNFIADIYKNRNTKDNFKEELQLKEDAKNPLEEENSKIVEQLLEIQRKMKEEVEKNPNIKSNLFSNDVEQTKDKKVEEVTNLENEKVEENLQKTEENEADKEETKKMDIKEIAEKLNNMPKGETEDFAEMYVKTFGKLPSLEENDSNVKYESSILEESELIKGDNISVFEEVEEYKNKPNYKFIGIAFSTYIIIEMDNELYIMDQHAAHERIMYERVKKNFYSDDEKDSQLMLLPDVITLTHKEMGIAKDNIKMFEKAGFILEEFGENTIKISGVPNVCINLDTKELFLETLDEINTVARTAKQEIEEKFIATVACKAAVKANMALTKEEVESLMNELLKLPNPFTCPHGRPTVIKMTKYDIERKFSRK